MSHNNIVVPVYYNGVADNNQAVEFKYNTEILSLEPVNNNIMVAFSNETKIACIISDGYFNPNEPIAYVTLDNSATSFNATNVKFYGNEAENISYKFNFNTQQHSNLLSKNMPNPAVNYTEFNIEIPENGNYKISISDNSGNTIKILANEYLNAGNINYI